MQKCEDSFTIEVSISMSKSISVGLAAMSFDAVHTKDWTMTKGWYINLKTLMRKREIDKAWN